MVEETHHNEEDAVRFLKALDPLATEFCFQLFKKTKDKELDKPPIYSSYEAAKSVFANGQARNFNVTVTLADTHGASRKIHDIRRIRAAYVDFDSKLVGTQVEYKNGTKFPEQITLDTFLKCPMPPHVVVQSSENNFHAYWLLQPIELGDLPDDIEDAAESYRQLQSTLAQYFGGDPGVTGINCCVRLPGYWRYKEDDEAKETMVHIIHYDDDMDFRYAATTLHKKFSELNGRKNLANVNESYDEKEERRSKKATEAEPNFVDDNVKVDTAKWFATQCDKLARMLEGGRDNALNKLCWSAGGLISAGRLEEEDAVKQIREAAIACGLSFDRIKDKLTRSIEAGKKKPIPVAPKNISMKKPTEAAKALIESHFTWKSIEGTCKTLYYWQNNFWSYECGSYTKQTRESVEVYVRSWFNSTVRYIKKGEGWTTVSNQAKSADWVELTKQLEMESYVPDATKFNVWVPGARQSFSKDYCIPFQNGLFDYSTNTLHPCTATFLNTSSVHVDYDPGAVEPTRWMQFLQECFTDNDGVYDEEAVNLLQEWFGYCMTLGNTIPKTLFVVGPTRSGKGTIDKVLRAMLGESACAFDLSTMTTDFGLEPLVGHSVAICSDLRDMGRDTNIVVERILKIVANDPMPVNVKFKSIKQVSLDIKMMMFSNTVPTFKDAHNAVGSRIMFIQMYQSFEGREDYHLLGKLEAEIQGIAMWAVEGIVRLHKNGQRFTEPKSVLDVRSDFKQNESPLQEFAERSLEFAPSCSCNKDYMYQEYRIFMEESGYRYIKDKQSFFTEFKHVFFDKGIGNKRGDPRKGPIPQYLKGVGLLVDEDRHNHSPSKPPPHHKRKDFHPDAPF